MVSKILNTKTGIGLLLILILITGCTKHRPELVWHQEHGYRWASVTHNAQGVGFKLLSPQKTGITFVNHLTKKDIVKNRYYLNGSGVAAGDVDGDGFVDLYFAQMDGPNHLYKNLGGMRFKDITSSAGVALKGYHCTGATFADVDGDGDLDLLVTTLGEGNFLFLNDGKGHFTLDKNSGLVGKKGSMTMALADIDGDGDLDLYITDYKENAVRDLYSPAQLAITKIVRKQGNNYSMIPPFDKYYKIIHTPEGPTMREIGEDDDLYLNDGHGHFTKVKDVAHRFLDENGKPEGFNPDWGLSAKFQDLNNDGRPDLYVCNDFWTPDRIWINQGNGTFKALKKTALRTLSFSSMSVDFSDINRDGIPDLFVTEMLNPHHKIRMRQFASFPPVMPGIGEIDNHPQYTRNTLFLGRKDGTYAEIARYSGVDATGWSWATNFLDVDLDGYEDILINTGNAYDELDLDTQQYISQLSQKHKGNISGYILKYPSLKENNVILRNNHNLTFSDSSAAWGFREKDVSNGMALADLDNDGDLDVIDNRLNETAGVYENMASAPRIAVRLEGKKPNTQGIGAKIELIGKPVTQTKQIEDGGEYLSCSEAEAMFAAGDDSSNHRIIVTWPSGEKTTVDSVKGDRIYVISELTKSGTTSRKSSVGSGNHTEQHPVFKDVSDRIHSRHHEDSFDDFKAQPLLPIKLSQLGPGVAWIDYNHDGHPDLFIGSGKGGTLGVYENLGNGHFRLRHMNPMTHKAPGDETGIIGWGTSKGTTVFVGSSNYEQSKNKDGVPSAYQYLISDNHAVETGKIPGILSSTGPIAAADVDGDGDLDLFVGGRFVPGKYPENATSRLFLNENGHFVLDKQDTTVFRNLGLVTNAVFTDYDQDGDPDLLCSTAWGSIKLFRNDKGVFHDVTKEMGLEQYKGWWNGIATGDFNNDGFPDFVATNSGLNTDYHIVTNHPIKIFYNHFNHDNRVEMLEATYDTSLDAYVPIRRLYTIYKSIPSVMNYVDSYRQFANSTLQEIVRKNLSYVPSKEINTLQSMVFINNGPGKGFTAHPLPVTAQLTAGFYAGVADFNNDGNEDIFLSQNLYALPKLTSRYDAGRGLWLEGDGKGNFKAVPGSVSGIKVYGEQRGAALGDFNNDGKVDLAVSQNGAETKLYLNTIEKRGYSIRLNGPAKNRDAVGSGIRLLYQDGTKGPRREIQAGSGYWSQNSFTQVLGYNSGKKPISIEITWFDGSHETVKIVKNKMNYHINYTGK